MKTTIGKFLCWIGIHDLDEDDWDDAYAWNEDYLYSVNYCKRCGKSIHKKLDVLK